MNQQIRELFNKAEGRYFDQNEQAQLESYASGLLARIEAAQAIERAESAILDDVVAAVLKEHAVMSKDYGKAAPQLVRRDQAMVLRYASFSMLMHDKNFIYDKLAVWLRTIMLALCKPEQVLFGYQSLVDACRKNLSHDDADAVVPYIGVVIQEFQSHGGQPS
jgi:hypothetical protein